MSVHPTARRNPDLIMVFHFLSAAAAPLVKLCHSPPMNPGACFCSTKLALRAEPGTSVELRFWVTRPGYLPDEVDDLRLSEVDPPPAVPPMAAKTPLLFEFADMFDFKCFPAFPRLFWSTADDRWDSTFNGAYWFNVCDSLFLCKVYACTESRWIEVGVSQVWCRKQKDLIKKDEEG